MDRAPELAEERDVLVEYEESGLRSPADFAKSLNVPVEWVEYWFALAGIRRESQWNR